MSFQWFGDEWLEKFKKDRVKNLKRACIYTTNVVKKELGTKCPPHSSPGEPPALESGELRRSITWEVDEDKVIGRVGTNKIYARYLAGGTSKMEPRDIFKGYSDNQEQILSILKGK